MKTLSPKQQQIYDYIISFAAQHGYPPSVREIGEHVGLKSPSTVHFHLKGLEAAGLISKEEGKTRAITICGGAGRALRGGARGARRPGARGRQCGGRVPHSGPECVEDYLTFDTDGLTGEHFALRVRGESMLYAGILPGDLVVVHQQQDARSGGDRGGPL